jgi:c-di-GMP phosphodiesterase
VVPDHLFLTGLFSLLEKMIEGPLEETLARVSVPPAVSDALLAGSGPLAPFLNLAIACEQGDQEAISNWAVVCRLDALCVNEEMLAALVWANEVLELDG